MKTLLLMRHAKSSWKDTSIPDHDRPLAKRGLRDSNRMGELLGQRELIPQVILCSSAVRAAETARIIDEVCGCNCPVTLSDKLYLAEADTYISELSQLPDDLERVMLIGHNPGLESLLQVLSGQIESLPTAVIAYLSLPIQHWADLITSTEGELIELWRPKELAEEVKTDHKKEKKDEKPAKKPVKAAKKEQAAEKKEEKTKKETAMLKKVVKSKKEEATPKKVVKSKKVEATPEKDVKPKKEDAARAKPAEKPVKKEKKKTSKK
jgi:phosphohistidine phosphatase